MSRHYVETDGQLLDIHYSRKDGTKINWMVDEVEQDSSHDRYVLYDDGVALGVLEADGTNWIMKVMIDTGRDIRVGIPGEFANKIVKCAKDNGLAS